MWKKCNFISVSAKKRKSNLPLKPIYIIDTPIIKIVLKGNGTANYAFL